MGEAKRRKKLDPLWGQKTTKKAFALLKGKGFPVIHPDNMAALWGAPRDITDDMASVDCFAISMALAEAVVIIDRFEGEDEVCRLATDEEVIALKAAQLIPNHIGLTSQLKKLTDQGDTA